MFLGGQRERTQSGQFIQPVKVSCHKSLSSTPLKFLLLHVKGFPAETSVCPTGFKITNINRANLCHYFSSAQSR